ncbi:hypothetical protein ACFLX3_05820 [Chloroflexota bacterium]
METSWKPVVAGILNIVVGVFTLFVTFIIAMILVGIGGSVLALGRVADWLPVWLSGFAQFAIVIIAFFLIIGSALPIIGGIYSIQRKGWGWALAGSIVAILSSTIPGMAATVLVALSKKEFEKTSRFR